jgi:hypothetical protein
VKPQNATLLVWWEVNDGACSQGGDHDPQKSEDCQPPDYHCSKCGQYLGPA